MRYWQTLATGRVIATEKDEVFVPYGWKFDQSKRVVIWLHGAGGDYQCGPVEKALAEALGVVWLNATLGLGSSVTRTWLQDAKLEDIAMDAFDWAKTTYNVNPDRCILWGGSMGGGEGLLTAIEYPDDVKAVGAAIPTVDPEYVRLNDPAGGANTTAIETWYGDNEVPADKQVYERGGDWPVDVDAHIWGSSTDTFTPSASTATFVAASGVGFTSLGAVGHSYLSIDFDEALEFLKPHV